jgi:hypothetical protein
MKKGGGGPSKKTEMKKKEKVVDDITFGLKNKNKSKAVQRYIHLGFLLSINLRTLAFFYIILSCLIFAFF